MYQKILVPIDLADPGQTVEFTITLLPGQPNQGEFDYVAEGSQEKGIVYLFCGGGDVLTLQKQSDYGPPQFSIPQGTCSGTGTRN